MEKGVNFFGSIRKKGISAIVATVLVILITIAGVVIIWTAIIPLVRENIEFSELKGGVSIISSTGYTAYDSEKNLTVVQIGRDAGDAVIRNIQVIFHFEGDSYISIVPAPGPNQRKAYTFNLSGYPAPTSISVAPFFVLGNKEKLGAVGSKVKVPYGNIVEVAPEDEWYNLGEDYSGNTGGGESSSCSVVGDCEDVGCKTKACVEGICIYTDVACDGGSDGCCPSGCTYAGGDTDCSQTCSDGDSDGYGSPASSACTYPTLDCDDSSSAINPGATEICDDSLDNDCDGDNDCLDSDCDLDPVCVVSGTEISSCQEITNSGNYYLGNDLYASTTFCLNIEADNVVINGNGFSIFSSNQMGISIQGSTSFSYNNLSINGIQFEINPGGYGLYVRYTNGLKVTDSNFDLNGDSTISTYGIYLHSGDNGIIEGNLFEDFSSTLRSYPMYIRSNSGRHQILNNNISSTYYGMVVNGVDNTIRGNRILNITNRAIDISQSGNTIEDNFISVANQGIFIGSGGNSLITNTICGGLSEDISTYSSSVCDATIFNSNTCDSYVGCSGNPCVSACS